MTIKFQRLLTALALLGITCGSPVFAIEGLQVSIQSSNVLLSWPSNPSESYIVQYRPTLDSSDSWQQLTNQYPADTGGSNITIFVHTNGAQYGTWTTNFAGGGSGTNTGVISPLSPGNGPSETNNAAASIQGVGFYQVVREGVYITDQPNLTNGTLSGTITLSIEAGNDTGILQEALVKIDGAPFTGGDGIFGAPWKLPFDTGYLANGTHTLQVEANWLNPDISDGNNFTFDIWSSPVTINVTNLISYPNWEPEIGTNSAYFLETVYTNANYEIDIYDVNFDYVQSLTGQATNGIIEAYWDMIDAGAYLRNDSTYDPYFYSIVTVFPDDFNPNAATRGVSGDTPSSYVQAVTPPKKQRPYNYPTQGGWVISYQDSFQYMQNSNQYYSAIYDMGSIGAQYGGAYTTTPHAAGQPDNGQTWPLRYPSTNAPSLVTLTTMILDKNALRSLLTNSISRNFYYNGHGFADGIAGVLSTSEISSYVQHYYRFVFLDACLSSSGGLPKAFGIPYNKSMPLSYFQKTGLRPRTFMGYPITVNYCYLGHYQDSSGNSYVGQIPDSVPYFLTNFEFYWYYNYDVTTAVGYAIEDTPYIGNNWETGETLQIFGYGGLGVNDYNFSDAW